MAASLAQFQPWIVRDICISKRRCRPTALSKAGQPDEAIKVLDGYLSRHPDDPDRLLTAMRLLYDARILGKPLSSPEEDRTQFLRYFSAYEKLNGSKLPQAQEWR